MGAPRRGRRERLQAALRRLPREARPGPQAQGAPQGRLRALPGDGRGPRGRVHRVAPARGAVAARRHARTTHGLPRDHPRRDRARRRGVPRHRPAPGGRAGGTPHPRPPLRLRGVAGPLEEGHAEAVGGPRPVGGLPDHRRARTRPHALQHGRLLGPRGHVRQGRPGVHRDTGRARRQAARDGQGLRRERRPDEGRRRHGRAGGARAGRARDGHGVRRTQRRGEAVPPRAVRAVHDVHAPAGGRPQAALLQPAHDAGRAAPVRERLHHLHAHRLDEPVGDGADGGAAAGAGAVRRGVRPRQAARLRQEGQERAGGARGDPPGGRHVPHAGGRLPRAVGRRAAPVRPGVEAHGRLADGRRDRAVAAGTPRHADRAGGRRVRGLRQGDHVPRLHAGVRRGRRRPRGRAGGPRGTPARAGPGRARRRRRHRGQGPHDPAARALHRGVAGEGAGGAGRREAEHVRLHHRHDPGPGVRLEEGHRAGAVVHGVRRRGAAGAALRAAGRLPLHRGDGGRPRRDRDGVRGPGRVAAALLRGQRRARPAPPRLRAPRRHRRARGQLHPDRQRRRRRRGRGARRQVRPVPPARRGPRVGAGGPAARRADGREGRGAAVGTLRRPGAGRRAGERVRGRREGGPLRPVRHDRSRRGVQGGGEDREPVQGHGPRHDRPRHRAAAADAAAHPRQ